jgi:hypothetical protein
MTYLVEFAARAARDLEILYVEKNAAESHAAAHWYNGLEEAVYGLASYPIAAQLPRKHEGRSESCDTCFTARRLTSIGSSMKSMKSDERCGCSRFATAHGRSSSHPMLNKSWRSALAL